VSKLPLQHFLHQLPFSTGLELTPKALDQFRIAWKPPQSFE
jgi:hypothetical protein